MIYGTGLITECAKCVQRFVAFGYIHIIAGRAARTNACLGVSVLLRRAFFTAADIVYAWAPSHFDLRGRYLEVRLRRGRFDLTLHCPYFPNMSAKRREVITVALSKLLSQMLDMGKWRTWQVVASDFNTDVGHTLVSGQRQEMDLPCFGQATQGLQNDNASHIAPLLAKPFFVRTWAFFSE